MTARTRRHQHPKALQEGAEVHVGLTGEFGAHRVSPRQLLAALQARFLWDVLSLVDSVLILY